MDFHTQLRDDVSLFPTEHFFQYHLTFRFSVYVNSGTLNCSATLYVGDPFSMSSIAFNFFSSDKYFLFDAIFFIHNALRQTVTMRNYGTETSRGRIKFVKVVQNVVRHFECDASGENIRVAEHITRSRYRQINFVCNMRWEE